MRKRILVLLLCSACHLAEAQFQNGSNGSTYNLGNVAIGTSNTGLGRLVVATPTPGDGIWLAGTSNSLGIFMNETSGGWSSLTQAGDNLLMWKGANPDAASAGGLVLAPWSNTANGLGMRIDPFGHVSIGTYNANNYSLAVNGPAIFTKVVVKPFSNWPDYVFGPGYYLPSLDSVHNYIQSNHHLPDVPSADSVAKNGIDLGNSQAVLLKKIEELTLYVIEQRQELEVVKAENKRLAAKIDGIRPTRKKSCEGVDQLKL